jgi:hypothetical protein
LKGWQDERWINTHAANGTLGADSVRLSFGTQWDNKKATDTKTRGHQDGMDDRTVMTVPATVPAAIGANVSSGGRLPARKC